jgi:hypothetical protein
MNWKKTLLFISTAIGTTTLAFHVINKFIFNASDEHSEEDESNYYNWKFIKKKELVLRFFLFMI